MPKFELISGKQKQKLKKVLNPLTIKYGHHIHRKGPEPSSDEGGIAVLSKRLRDTTRLMQHKQLTTVKRQELERQVKAIELQIQKKKKLQKENDLQAKYKYIKFVEAKKVDRKIAQLTKEDCEESGKWELYRRYIRHYPRDLKYISLFPKTESDPKTLRLKTEILQMVQDASAKRLFDNPLFVLRYSDFHSLDEVIPSHGDKNIEDEFFI